MDNIKTISGTRFKNTFTSQGTIVKKKHLQDCGKFARDHLSWDGNVVFKKWKNILLSDESKFMLFGNNGKRFARRPKNQAFNPL